MYQAKDVNRAETLLDWAVGRYRRHVRHLCEQGKGSRGGTG